MSFLCASYKLLTSFLQASYKFSCWTFYKLLKTTTWAGLPTHKFEHGFSCLGRHNNNDNDPKGATTFSITTFSITTLSIIVNKM